MASDDDEQPVTVAVAAAAAAMAATGLAAILIVQCEGEIGWLTRSEVE